VDAHPGRFEYRHDFPPLQTQRQVLYLGEINDSQKAAWCRTIKVLYEDGTGAAQVALFPEDRVAPELDCDVVRIRLKRLWRRLGELAHQSVSRDQLLIKLGAAKKEAGSAYRLVDIRLPEPKQPVNPQTFTFALNRNTLRQVRRREGRYLLRSNLTAEDPALLWQHYIQLRKP